MNRRLLGYLVVNVIVSAAVIIIILIIYDRFIRTVPPVSTLDPAASSGVLIAAINNAGQLDQETVILRNTGKQSVSLKGWALNNVSGAQYTFPDLALEPGGPVDLHSGTGNDSPADLYWNRSTAAWKSGDLATLSDPQGGVEAVYRVP
jgi:hypothetical protein